MNRKIYALFGLAMRARMVESGAFLTDRCVKSRKAALVVLAEDASERTKKDIRNLCTSNKVMLIEFGSKQELGRCLGQEERSCLALKDPRMSEEICRLLRADES